MIVVIDALLTTFSFPLKPLVKLIVTFALTHAVHLKV